VNIKCPSVSTGSIYNLSSHTAYNNEYDINTIPPTSLLFDISSRPPSPKREREREREGKKDSSSSQFKRHEIPAD